MALLNVLRAAWRHPEFRSNPALMVRQRIRWVYDGPYTAWLLFGLGILRAILFVMAYPPAHGADSVDYFLYAAQFEGLDAPVVFQLIYPLYPLFIYFTHYVLGNVYMLIAVQLILSTLQGLLFYWGIRLYSPALAFVMALLVILDAQTGILYNFTSTEPLYMTVLALAFCLFLVQIKRPTTARWHKGDLLLGVVIALVLLSRPVGRYLVAPFGLLFLLGTRSLWRTAAMVTVYGVVLVASIMFNKAVFDQLDLNGGGNFMLRRPLIRTNLMVPENGPASARLIEMQAQCTNEETLNQCFIRQAGEWRNVTALYTDAYWELWRARGPEYTEYVFNAFTDYLTMSGQQYRGTPLPSTVQCEDVAAVADRNTTAYLENDEMFYGVTSVTYESFYPIILDIRSSMCPPLASDSNALKVVDFLGLRYRSLSRPHPYLWYATLGALVLAIPWARRNFLVMVLLAGAILANHAGVSAMVLNVQPRYVVVANPYKGILLLVWFFVAGRFALRVVDEWLLRRENIQLDRGSHQ